MEKEIAAHSSTLVWKIPWMEEPGGLQSMGSQRVGHDKATNTHTHTHTHTRFFLILKLNESMQISNSGHPTSAGLCPAVEAYLLMRQNHSFSRYSS